MKRNIFWTAVLFVVFGFSLFAQSKGDVIYQVSTLGALQEGVYDGVEPIETLLKYGDTGIGTFDGLDGEMIILNGTCYQVKADGKVYKVAKTVKTPFAAVSFFDTDQKIQITERAPSLAALYDTILKALPTKNIPYLIKITGTAAYVKTRSVPKQQKPYPRLVEVTKNQPTFEAKDIEGTLIGVWLPEYMAGVNMAGFHLHFISKDLSFGGHLLEIDMPKATVEIDYTYGLQLTLPSQSDFFTTTLKQDKEELKKIEQ
ncbi:MAG TPA: acetolactate decarboxylase [Termitinemataceae bacterium]|nr:acetolactate decarboxylase [Termitinemataceae bacterium]HOM22795.1 acetolactate decarboxylase [Termitinemataceae bacterium]HPQ00705.1 acetolactate decarboxylase [Termitinemataceae bacterium]